MSHHEWNSSSMLCCVLLCCCVLPRAVVCVRRVLSCACVLRACPVCGVRVHVGGGGLDAMSPGDREGAHMHTCRSSRHTILAECTQRQHGSLTYTRPSPIGGPGLY